MILSDEMITSISTMFVVILLGVLCQHHQADALLAILHCVVNRSESKDFPISADITECVPRSLKVDYRLSFGDPISLLILLSDLYLRS